MRSLIFASSLYAVTFAIPQISSGSPWDLFSKRASSGCSTAGQASCHNTTSQKNLCCFESPGGLLLQTQFWDTNPSTGPRLWPDNCDTTFVENCDPSRAYTDISGLLTNAGATDTLSFMQTHWVDINGQNEQFWEHEWSTHGTCMSTLEPPCLPSGSGKGAEAVDFFNTVVRLFKTLPTFDWLSQQGITPSKTAKLTLSQLTSALKTASGFTPALSCSSGTLNAISWYFNLKGSVIDGTFIPIDAPEKGTCPSTGILYPPKSGGSSTPTTSSSGPTNTQPSGSLPTKATISTSSGTGGLLSAGTWSTQTLATYSLSGSATSFTMSTSKGNCAIQSGALTCGSGLTASSFSTINSGGQLLLGVGGSPAFSSDGIPSGTVQETVFTGSGHAQDYSLVINGK